MIDRFKTLLQQLHLSPSEFADRIGVQRSSVSHILSGRNKPSIDFLEKILNAFPETDANWLISGKPAELIIAGKGKPDLQLEEQQFPREEPELNKIKNPPDIPSQDAVDQIIVVFKNNTFRLLKPE